MYFLLNTLGILVVIGIVYLCSPNKRNFKWKSILTLLIVEFLITWFMLSTEIGTWVINQIASFYT
jgi:purine nucleoside transport protein